MIIFLLMVHNYEFVLNKRLPKRLEMRFGVKKITLWGSDGYDRGYIYVYL